MKTKEQRREEGRRYRDRHRQAIREYDGLYRSVHGERIHERRRAREQARLANLSPAEREQEKARRRELDRKYRAARMATARISAEWARRVRWIRRFMERVVISGGCVLWLGVVDKGGYARIKPPRWLGVPRSVGTYGHRLVFWLVNGEVPAGGMYVTHSCGHAACVNPDHLVGGTASKNHWDAILQGTKGAFVLKYPDELIERVRGMYAAGMTVAAIARSVGVSYVYAWKVAHGQIRCGS